MLMPEKIDNNMFAPCGVDCMTCTYHISSCPGCRMGNHGKTKSTLKCKIKACFDNKKFKYCSRCSQFPCKLIKKHDKNYKKRYNISPINNSKEVENRGINNFMKKEQLEWSCPDCNHIISFNDKICSNCKKIKEENI
ncbi:MAG: DUF3795 domain-containing protein [Methanobacteriaceae archaeon]|nr:DUF3795 domain-containing protein [Methanobacteriaceae archaeon]